MLYSLQAGTSELASSEVVFDKEASTGQFLFTSLLVEEMVIEKLQILKNVSTYRN